ncbi:MAG TPA: DUF5666 domain-containing protein [Rhizobacter sp.]
MKRLRFPRLSSTTALSAGAVLALLLLSAVLPGCGGVDSGGTGQTAENPSTTSGRITGFGSVIVNGIRFDDDGAVVVDDEGVVHPLSDLRLGLVVEVQGRVRGNSGQGTADRIQFGPEIVGPVESVDAAGTRLVVLGQTVRVDADTLFDGFAGGLADVQAGKLVAVHGFYDSSSGVYTATRLENRVSLPHYTLRGRIANLARPPARTFTIGAAPIDYGAVPAPSLPPLADGLLVRVTLGTTPVGGRWVASAVRSAQRSVPDRNEAQVEGHVSGFVNSADFLVAGLRVDASGPGVNVRHGTLADLADGVRVEVDGVMQGGVLVASEVDFKRGGREEFELHGAVESVDAATQTLAVRGVTAVWDGSTRFAGGNAANLVAGARVEVRGAPAGGRLRADMIRFVR